MKNCWILLRLLSWLFIGRFKNVQVFDVLSTKNNVFVNFFTWRNDFVFTTVFCPEGTYWEKAEMTQDNKLDLGLVVIKLDEEEGI